MKPMLKVFCVLLAGTMLIFSGCGSDGDDDPCKDVTCQANASCVEGNCQCNTGFHMEGDTCVEDQTDPCADVSCGANQHCEDQSGTGVCVCDTGYHDDNGTCVEDQTDPCDGVSCDANEHCEDQSGTGVCVCDDGYHDDNGTCVEDQTVECCGHGTLNGTQDACTCDSGFNDDDGDLLCSADAPAVWPPEVDDLLDLTDPDNPVCVIPACDAECGSPGDFDPSGMWTRVLTTTESNCTNAVLVAYDARMEVGNVATEEDQTLGDVHGNCSDDEEGNLAGAFYDNIVATCNANAQDLGVTSWELGVVTYSGDAGTGTAHIFLTGVPEALGGNCDFKMTIEYTRQ